MKKAFKTLAGIGALAAFAGGVYYAYKRYRQEEIQDEFDDDEFDLFDGNTSDRSYVTLDMDGSSEEKKDEAAPEESFDSQE